MTYVCNIRCESEINPIILKKIITNLKWLHDQKLNRDHRQPYDHDLLDWRLHLRLFPHQILCDYGYAVLLQNLKQYGGLIQKVVSSAGTFFCNLKLVMCYWNVMLVTACPQLKQRSTIDLDLANWKTWQKVLIYDWLFCIGRFLLFYLCYEKTCRKV